MTKSDKVLSGLVCQIKWVTKRFAVLTDKTHIKQLLAVTFNVTILQ